MEKWKTGEIEMGPRYYQTLRSEFANHDAIDFKLKPTNPDDKQDDQLHAALTALITSKTQVSEFLDWAENVKAVSNYFLFVVYKQRIRMRPEKTPRCRWPR